MQFNDHKRELSALCCRCVCVCVWLPQEIWKGGRKKGKILGNVFQNVLCIIFMKQAVDEPSFPLLPPLSHTHTHTFWGRSNRLSSLKTPSVRRQSIRKEIMYWSFVAGCLFPLIPSLSKQPIEAYNGEYISPCCWNTFFSSLFLAAGSMTMKCANTGRNGPARGCSPQPPACAQPWTVKPMGSELTYVDVYSEPRSERHSTSGCLTCVCYCSYVILLWALAASYQQLTFVPGAGTRRHSVQCFVFR